MDGCTMSCVGPGGATDWAAPPWAASPYRVRRRPSFPARNDIMLTAPLIRHQGPRAYIRDMPTPKKKNTTAAKLRNRRVLILRQRFPPPWDGLGAGREDCRKLWPSRNSTLMKSSASGSRSGRGSSLMCRPPNQPPRPLPPPPPPAARPQTYEEAVAANAQDPFHASCASRAARVSMILRSASALCVS
jgi:hypothetical protein